MAIHHHFCHYMAQNNFSFLISDLVPKAKTYLCEYELLFELMHHIVTC